MSTIRFSIVVPLFNEAANVKEVVAAFFQLAMRLNDLEIIFVDGASQDGTPELLTSELSRIKSERMKLLALEGRGGYGQDIMRGLQDAGGQFLGWTHADLQTDPTDLLRAFELIEKNPQNTLVKGRRQGRRIFDVAFTSGMELVVRLLLNEKLSDINAQPKVFNREFYKKCLIGQAPSDFSLDLFLLLQAVRSHHKIVEFPVHFHPRIAGEAKGGGSLPTKIALTRRTLKYILGLR
jgi:glycosyltransferase involved in cell wall biosynthesis